MRWEQLSARFIMRLSWKKKLGAVESGPHNPRHVSISPRRKTWRCQPSVNCRTCSLGFATPLLTHTFILKVCTNDSSKTLNVKVGNRQWRVAVLACCRMIIIFISVCVLSFRPSPLYNAHEPNLHTPVLVPSNAFICASKYPTLYIER